MRSALLEGARVAAVLALLGPSGPASAAPILDADFDDKTVDAPIGTGGAAVGEPVTVSSDIDAVVRATPFASPSLEIAREAPISATQVRFEFLDSVEISSCRMQITGKLWFDTVEIGYTVRLREQGGSGSVFLNLNFSTIGISYTDADTPAAVVIGEFETDVEIAFDLRFDLTAGTYDIRIDGELLVDNQPHGVVGNGIGRVLVGMNSASAVGPIWLDDLLVEDFGGLLCASFEGGTTGEWTSAVPN